jgi:uncharacterized protein with PIN domain
VYNYLKQLKLKLNLEFNFRIEKGRCSVCNSSLIKVSNKNLVKDLVKPDSFKNYSEFYQCSNNKCNQVFWKGPHITDIVAKIRKMVDYD